MIRLKEERMIVGRLTSPCAIRLALGLTGTIAGALALPTAAQAATPVKSGMYLDVERRTPGIEYAMNRSNYIGVSAKTTKKIFWANKFCTPTSPRGEDDGALVYGIVVKSNGSFSYTGRSDRFRPGSRSRPRRDGPYDVKLRGRFATSRRITLTVTCAGYQYTSTLKYAKKLPMFIRGFPGDGPPR